MLVALSGKGLSKGTIALTIRFDFSFRLFSILTFSPHPTQNRVPPTMSLQTSQELLTSLRVTLQKLEQNPDPAQDPGALAELKTILLNRIAELEVALTLEPAVEASKPPLVADLVPPASMSDVSSGKDAPDPATPLPAEKLEKLD